MSWARSLRVVGRIAYSSSLRAPATTQVSTRSISNLARPSFTTPRIATCVGGLRRYSVEPTAISIEEFHDIADEYLESVLVAYEEYAEEVDSNELDIDLAQGVMSLELPGVGSYVINKQPPNKQIWLSSPISGPKRFDYVDGQWVYLRDNSTLSGLLEKETTDAFASTGKVFSI